MKLHFHSRPRPTTQGYVLLIVMVMLAISIVAAVSLSTYNAHQVRLNQRNNDYFLAIGAAEAATEKVLSQMTSDFRDYGSGYLIQKLNVYRTNTPSPSEYQEWGNFRFLDLGRNEGRVDVQFTPLPGFLPLGGQFGTLRAFKDRVRILANAQPINSRDYVVGSVYQDVELTRIPIFQFAVYYNVPLEITPGADMTITGAVHCNTNIFVCTSATLTFYSNVTSSGTVYLGANPLSPKVLTCAGTVNFPPYNPVNGVSSLSLPIGTNNSPAAVRQVLEMPFPGEDPLSSLGRERYYNKADLIVTVSNSAVSVKSGLWDNFATTLSSNAVFTFVSTNTSFFNKRENKTIKPIQINVAKLVQWNATNSSVRPYLPLHDVRTVYVVDRRTFAVTNESGVRLVNGTNLPPQGLTVATPAPLYVLGHYNVPLAARGTTNTTGTLPASLAADAITILSTNWMDTNSTKTLANRVGGDTTVNAAFLMGNVGTTLLNDSGGLENFPRFLETWSGKTFTYNGSMICMFNSQVATGVWKDTGAGNDHYNAPIRKWALDQNFQYPDKLPPATPSLAVLIRANWRISAAYSTNVMAGF